MRPDLRAAAAAALIACLSACVPSADKAADVVREYGELDHHGARLSRDDYLKSRALVTWKEETAWDEMEVVEWFAVGSAKVEGGRATVKVTYQPILRISGYRFAERPGTPETVVFELVPVGDSWKISAPMIPPHVSRQAAIGAMGQLYDFTAEGTPERADLWATLDRLNGKVR
jgi:hypothetical protein